MLETDRIKLRRLTNDDATERYVNWMNNYEVTKYTESRFYLQDIESVRQFIANANNATTVTFAIIEKSSNLHVGNIKIADINLRHGFADVGLIIGDTACWGKGYGSEAIALATEYAFQVLNLHMLWAGIYAPNIGSRKAFEKAGYRLSYIMQKRYLFEGAYVDCYIMERFRKE